MDNTGMLSHADLFHWKSISWDGIWPDHSRPKNVWLKVYSKLRCPGSGWPPGSVTERRTPPKKRWGDILRKRHFAHENNWEVNYFQRSFLITSYNQMFNPLTYPPLYLGLVYYIWSLFRDLKSSLGVVPQSVKSATKSQFKNSSKKFDSSKFYV